MLAKITFIMFIIYLIVVWIGKFYYKFILNTMDKIRFRCKNYTKLENIYMPIAGVIIVIFRGLLLFDVIYILYRLIF